MQVHLLHRLEHPALPRDVRDLLEPAEDAAVPDPGVQLGGHVELPRIPG